AVGSAAEREAHRRKAGMADEDGAIAQGSERALRPVAFAASSPGPGVGEPDLRQDDERRLFGAAILDGEARQDVVGRGLRVFDRDVEIVIPFEDAGVRELEFGRLTAAAAILFDQTRIRKFTGGVLVESLRVAVRGRGVEIEVALLHVLAVIALGPR